MENRPPGKKLPTEDSADMVLPKDEPKERILSKLGLSREKPEVRKKADEEEEDENVAETKGKKASKEKKGVRRFTNKFGGIFASIVSLGERPEKSRAPKIDKDLHDSEELAEDKRADANQIKPTMKLAEQSDATAGSQEAVFNAQARPEHISHIVKRRVEGNTAALAAAERVNKKREAKARWRIRKLKKEAKTARREREEIKKQQKEFEKKLDENIQQTERLVKKSDKTEVVAVPMPEAVPQVKTLETKEPTFKPELSHEQIEKLVPSGRPAKPEDVLKKVAEAAEKNVPIERLYERRHELKEDSTRRQLIKLSKDLKKQNAKRAGAISSVVSSLNLELDKGKPPPVPPPIKIANNQTTMYKQAIASGFITAVVLLAIVVTIIILA